MVWRWGPDLYGEWVLISALVATGMLSPDLGFAHAAGNHIPRLAVEGNEPEAARLFRTTLVYLPVLAGCFAVAVVALAAMTGPEVVGAKHFGRGEFVAIVALLAASLVIAQQYFMLSPVYKIAGRNARLSLILSMGLALEFIGGMIIIGTGAQPLHFASWLLVFRAILLFVLWIDARRLDIRIFAAARTPGPRSAIALLAPMGSAAAGQALTPVVNGFQTHGLTLVAGLCLSPAVAGNLQALRTLANSVKSVVTTINVPVAQELPVLIGRKQTRRIQKLSIVAIHVGLVAALCIIVPLLLFGDKIMTVWLGAQMTYHPALAAFVFISVLAFPFHSAASVLLLAANRIQAAIIAIALLTAIAVGIATLTATRTGTPVIGLLLVVLEFGNAAITIYWVNRYFFRPNGIGAKLLQLNETWAVITSTAAGMMRGVTNLRRRSDGDA